MLCPVRFMCDRLSWNYAWCGGAARVGVGAVQGHILLSTHYLLIKPNESCGMPDSLETNELQCVI